MSSDLWNKDQNISIKLTFPGRYRGTTLPLYKTVLLTSEMWTGSNKLMAIKIFYNLNQKHDFDSIFQLPDVRIKHKIRYNTICFIDVKFQTLGLEV